MDYGACEFSTSLRTQEKNWLWTKEMVAAVCAKRKDTHATMIIVQSENTLVFMIIKTQLKKRVGKTEETE